MSHHQNHHTYAIGRRLRVLFILATLAPEVEHHHQQKLEPPIDTTIPSLELSNQLSQLIIAIVAATLLPLQIRLQHFDAPPLLFDQSCRPALMNNLKSSINKRGIQ
jgi:hypothetical protein